MYNKFYLINLSKIIKFDKRKKVDINYHLDLFNHKICRFEMLKYLYLIRSKYLFNFSHLTISIILWVFILLQDLLSFHNIIYRKMLDYRTIRIAIQSYIRTTCIRWSKNAYFRHVIYACTSTAANSL